MGIVTNAVATAIRARLALRRENERRQGKLLDENSDFAETIATKLHGLVDNAQFTNFQRCGHERIWRTCKCCGEVEEFTYRCSLKWCPRCQWRITDERKKILTAWATKIKQPKHLVLTQRNFPILTKKRIRAHTHALAAMRRSKCFRQVKGGCVSVEVTNEGNGWHLHSHWLLDCRWLDMEAVSRRWARLVEQEFAIVKVKDVRGSDYLKEVSKYVCEGSELASWPREHIAEFVLAVRGCRFFFPFGTLFHMAPEIRALLRSQKPAPAVCDCGASDWLFEDETQAVLNQIKKLKRR